jgi:hypothetical protein
LATGHPPHDRHARWLENDHQLSFVKRTLPSGRRPSGTDQPVYWEESLGIIKQLVRRPIGGNVRLETTFGGSPKPCGDGIAGSSQSPPLGNTGRVKSRRPGAVSFCDVSFLSPKGGKKLAGNQIANTYSRSAVLNTPASWLHTGASFTQWIFGESKPRLP